MSEKISKSIFVTKPFLPPKEEYFEYISRIYENNILTNHGPIVNELEERLKDYLCAPYVHFLTNGTIALQLTLSSLGINDGEIITTPFSYVATTSSILWQRCTPVFVDIERDNFTIDVSQVEKAITSNTRAIMAVHVFGYSCDVIGIEKIAKKHNIKVIYDAAHAFGVKRYGKPLTSYGDVSVLSFHATKLFHTGEGGACVTNDKTVSDNIEMQKRFGHNADDHIMLGINAKNSEFHAAMGLANFKYINRIINERKRICEVYDRLLSAYITRPTAQTGLDYNYAYYPVLFKSEEELLDVFTALNAEYIYPRRYFFPSLNRVSYINGGYCPVSENITLRIACLPLYVGLDDDCVDRIGKIIIGAIK